MEYLSATVTNPHLPHTEEPGWLLSLSLKEKVATFAQKEGINGLEKKVFKKKNIFGGKKKRGKKLATWNLFLLTASKLSYPENNIF